MEINEDDRGYDLDARRITFKARLDAAKFLDALEAVVAVPAVMYQLLQSVVVYSQRSRPGQMLNARQLFALADDRFIESSIRTEERITLALYATLLLILGWSAPASHRLGWFANLSPACVIPPIKSLVVSTTTLRVPSGQELAVELDPQPGPMKRVEQFGIVEKAKFNMINVQWGDYQPHVERRAGDIRRIVL